MMQLFVGSLSFASTKEDVKKLFEQFGAVASVTILMNKKGRKSRGFGFVEMADEQAARSAIAALDGKDFMGRALKAMVARPKPIKQPEPEQQRDMRSRDRSESRQFPPQENFESDAGFRLFPERPRRFKGGRRSTSYLRRVANKTDEEIRAMKEARPWQKRRGPPKPRQRREGQFTPWQKSEGLDKPWQKPRSSAKKPYWRAEGPAKPGGKPGEHSRPWQRAEGPVKPWQRREGPPKPWQKPEGRSKPWKKSEGLAKPWKKTAGSAAKSRRSSSGPAPRSRFKPRKR